MNTSDKNYINIGFIKNIVICIYDLMLLFSVLFFMSLPVILISDGQAIINNVLYQLYLLIIILFYYLWFWIKHNQTLGMKSWKTYIVNSKNENKLSIKQCLLRLIVSLLGGHILLIVHKHSLQDLISKTKIIRKISNAS